MRTYPLGVQGAVKQEQNERKNRHNKISPCKPVT